MTQPKAGVGAVIFHKHKILLVKRGNPPYQHEWAIPGGKIKPGETLQQAAEREILEETGITIKAGEAVFAFDIIEKDSHGNILFHYVIVDLAGTYIKGEVNTGSDASAAGWFTKTELASLNLNQATMELLQRYPAYES